MPELNETILDRIRKVQGYLRSDNPNEAAVAAAKLSELLIKYNIELSDIPAEQRAADPFVNRTSDTETNRLPEWRITLAVAVAKANLCTIVISGSHLQWMGRGSNVEVAQYIYETCATDLQRIADGLWYALRDMLKDDPSIKLIHGRTWKADFLRGAADGVRAKLQEETERWVESNQSVSALMITNSRELSVYKHSQYPSLLRHSGGGYSRGSNSYGLGVETGRNISFKTGVGAGGSSGTKLIRG